jgi:hypothetical protein
LVRRPLISSLYQTRMIDDVECGAVGGMRIGRGNRRTRRKPAPVPLCPAQIPHDLTWARTWAAAVGSRWYRGNKVSDELAASSFRVKESSIQRMGMR